MPRIGIRPIKVKKFTDWKKAKRILQDAMRNEVGPLYLKWHNAIVRNWNTKPTFKARTYVTPRKLSLDITVGGPGAKRWWWIDKGTKPRVIRAKPGKSLRFRPIHFPKTTQFGGFGGPGSSAGPVLYRKSVYHKGIKSRQFIKKIVKPQTDQQVRRILNEAMKRATRAK